MDDLNEFFPPAFLLGACKYDEEMLCPILCHKCKTERGQRMEAAVRKFLEPIVAAGFGDDAPLFDIFHKFDLNDFQALYRVLLEEEE